MVACIWLRYHSVRLMGMCGLRVCTKETTAMSSINYTDEQFEQRMCEQDYMREHEMQIGYDTLTGEEVDLDPRGYCKHGVYVGGCGADYMCGHCEMGEDTLEMMSVAQVAVFGTGVNGRFVTHVEPPTTLADAIKSAMFWQNAFED